jgi:hypothetical protein
MEGLGEDTGGFSRFRVRDIRGEERDGWWVTRCLCTKYNVEMTDESERGGEI